MPDDLRTIAERFRNGVAGTPDESFAELFAPTVRVRHSYDAEAGEFDGAAFAAMTAHDDGSFAKLMPGYEPAPLRVFWGDDGFALARRIAGTLEDGTVIDYQYCAVATVEAGRIVSIEAYQDRGQAEALGAAMMALMSDGSAGA